MGHWNYVTLAVFGDKKDVNAFHRVAYQLQVSDEYVLGDYEDLYYEKPLPWHKHWWRSEYYYATKSVDLIPSLQLVSKTHPRLCFLVKWDSEHELFGAYFVRKGKVESHEVDAEERILELRQAMGANDDDIDPDKYADIGSEIDVIVYDEFDKRMEKLWEARIYRILYAQRRQKSAST